MAQTLGIESVRREPEQHATLQHVGKLISATPLRLRVREREEHGFGPAEEPVLGTGGRWRGWRGWGGRGRDPAAFGTGGGDLFYQGLAVVQRHVQAEICKVKSELVWKILEQMEREKCSVFLGEGLPERAMASADLIFGSTDTGCDSEWVYV